MYNNIHRVTGKLTMAVTRVWATDRMLLVEAVRTPSLAASCASQNTLPTVAHKETDKRG